MGPKKAPVVLLVGRAHFYEGHSMELVTFATRVCKILGVETMIGLLLPIVYSNVPSLTKIDSYECSRWPKPRLLRW